MKKRYLPLLFSVLALFTACDDWLDVQQDTEKKQDEMFDTYKGFQGALAGCYDDMASNTLYGQNLTYTYIESMANLWDIGGANNNPTHFHFMKHDYGHSNTEAEIKSLFSKFFNTILEANMVIRGCQEKGRTLSAQAAAVIEGEARAIRAYCQFDVLRLFGQLPSNPTIRVSLPYSEVTTKDERPVYLNYDAYVQKLESDIDAALSLLKEHDPVMEYTYDEINHVGTSDFKHVQIEDDFLHFRQHRMNYWAVKALQARLYRYTGQSDKAYQAAMEVIGAQTKSGAKVVELSGQADTRAHYFTNPSEALFMLAKVGKEHQTVNLLLGDEDIVVREGEVLLIKESMYTSLFEGAWASDIRKQNLWAPVQTSQAKKFMSIRKHYYDSDKFSSWSKTLDLATKLEVLPLIRLSEMYLIAVESAPTLAESNQLYVTYLASKNAQMETPFATDQDIRKEMLKEYRREFFAEGQMFYLYKRTNTTHMWSKENVEVTEADYILPLPATEYNPHK